MAHSRLWRLLVLGCCVWGAQGGLWAASEKPTSSEDSWEFIEDKQLVELKNELESLKKERASYSGIWGFVSKVPPGLDEHIKQLEEEIGKLEVQVPLRIEMERSMASLRERGRRAQQREALRQQRAQEAAIQQQPQEIAAACKTLGVAWSDILADEKPEKAVEKATVARFKDLRAARTLLVNEIKRTKQQKEEKQKEEKQVEGKS